MKSGTVIAFKLACFLTIPACGVFVALLKPHVEKGDWPNGVAFTVAIIMAVANVANAGLAFTSGSFAKWQEKNGSASTTTATVTTSTESTQPKVSV